MCLGRVVGRAMAATHSESVLSPNHTHPCECMHDLNTCHSSRRCPPVPKARACCELRFWDPHPAGKVGDRFPLQCHRSALFRAEMMLPFVFGCSLHEPAILQTKQQFHYVPSRLQGVGHAMAQTRPACCQPEAQRDLNLIHREGSPVVRLIV